MAADAPKKCGFDDCFLFDLPPLTLVHPAHRALMCNFTPRWAWCKALLPMSWHLEGRCRAWVRNPLIWTPTHPPGDDRASKPKPVSRASNPFLQECGPWVPSLPPSPSLSVWKCQVGCVSLKNTPAAAPHRTQPPPSLSVSVQML